MAKPYSEDLRRLIVRGVEAGRSRHEVARIFGVSPSFVIKLMQRYRETGSVRSAKFGGYRKPILTGHEDKVRELVAARPEMTISELANELARLGIQVGRTSVHRFLRRLGLTFKKRMARPVRKGAFVEMAADQSASTYPASRRSLRP